MLKFATVFLLKTNFLSRDKVVRRSSKRIFYYVVQNKITTVYLFNCNMNYSQYVPSLSIGKNERT